MQVLKKSWRWIPLTASEISNQMSQKDKGHERDITGKAI